jgi:RNA recognition motif-containing protein
VSEDQRTLYVGNLPWAATEDDLTALFKEFGPLVGARVIQDRLTGRSSGYGFVEFATEEQAAQACAALDGCLYRGRALLVGSARPKPSRH